ncbi:hypothetical protein GCM10009630_49000 [Kribbella jejuensis]|uniref:Nitrite reductase/ring-hydroxylating ferredoxin subunit n=1 Tax=Kribbella jejuensis TaxID=236068 RepID=A0A542E7H5_9ACTN|nr:Rieske 2Fe-2S domain-containing protein [Kribbella jejuensis]TQJ11288.1 nitrite reductase/ring-hydroxylating ferredoxin subunit [Kribbella jejuensis]
MTGLRKLVQRLEELTPIDRAGRPTAAFVRRLTASDPVKNVLSGTWLGHQLHPVLTDLPIGAWTMATALDLTAGRRADDAARRLVGIGVLTAVPAAAAGASDWSETYGGEQRVGIVHALANSTGTVLQVAAWFARRGGHRATGVALSATGLGITLGAAYLGGYLSFTRGVGVDHTAFQSAVTDWTDVAAVSAIQDDKPLRVTAGDVPVMLVRHNGELHALSATCTHAGGPLDEGQLVDGCIRCPWHSSTFRLDDGSVVRGPATADEPAWQLKIEGDRVLVRR